jgi:hypothetical protein
MAPSVALMTAPPGRPLGSDGRSSRDAAPHAAGLLVDFRVFDASLGLTYPLSELLPGERGSAPLLIVDGLDRLSSDNAFRDASQLLRLARQKAPATRWRVLVPCQAPGWPRVLEGIERGAGSATREVTG